MQPERTDLKHVWDMLDAARQIFDGIRLPFHDQRRLFYVEWCRLQHAP
jgi:hypothetical protein